MLKLSNRNLEQTILLITHDEKIALEADRIITIEDGRIIGDEKQRTMRVEQSSNGRIIGDEKRGIMPSGQHSDGRR